MEHKTRQHWLYGTGVSVGMACLLIFATRGWSRASLVPILFIGVAAGCARLFGMLAGVIGSLAAAWLFACFLFEPYGTFHIRNDQAMFNLGLMLFAGIALSYAWSGHSDKPRRRRLPI